MGVHKSLAYTIGTALSLVKNSKALIEVRSVYFQQQGNGALPYQ